MNIPNTPWYHLRVSPSPPPPPIAPGVWMSSGDTPNIELVKLNSIEARLRFGRDENTEQRFTERGLRLLAAFCLELADQMKGTK